MRVFVTLGFERRPFDRLLKAIDKGVELGIIPDDTFVQKGHSQYTPKNCASQCFLEYDAMIASMQAADIVVAHAGVGTVLLCLRLGKIPILYPRISRLGEHVDDHQVEFAQTMQRLNRALVVHDADQLFKTFRQYPELKKDLLPGTTENRGLQLATYLKSLLIVPRGG